MSRTKKYTIEEKKISGIYSNIKQRNKSIESWPRKDFINWYLQNNIGCYYCKTSNSDLKKFYELTYKDNKRRDQRGKSLEVDRIKGNGSYSENNCVLACYWCNNAKTDVFNERDMKSIGLTINEVIKERIHNG